MRTSTYRSASGFFSLGDIDIGAEEASRERDIEVDNGDSGDDDDDGGYPAYSHHDKIPPWWGIVSNDEGGNVPVSQTHHTP